MKRRSVVLAAITVLVVLGASSLYAQDNELTLAGLAQQLAALSERVTAGFAAQGELTKRLAAVETAVAPTPTPTPTATPTPSPELPRFNTSYEEMGKEYSANQFAFAKKYGEYDGELVEIEGRITSIGDNYEGSGLPYIQVGFIPTAYCPLEDITEELLLDLRTDDMVIVRGIFVDVLKDDPLPLYSLENCEIVSRERSSGESSR